MTLLLGGSETFLPARRLALFWAGIPHQVLAREADETWLMQLPLGWFLERRLPTDFVTGALEGRVFFEPDIDHFDCDLFRMQLWSQRPVDADPMLGRAVELEVEARLFRLAAGLPQPLPALRDTTDALAPPDKAMELARRVARSCTQPFSVAEFSRVAGLHRNYAMNLFRQKLGTSLVEYLTQNRLAHAMRLLVSTGAPVSEIARHSGFGSVERLRVTFRQAFKCSPIRFRKQHQRPELVRIES